MAFPLSRAALLRCLPFGLFVLALALRAEVASLDGFDARWIYGAGAVVVALVTVFYRREYGELSRQLAPDARELALALVVGLAVFVLWIQLDAPWMVLGNAAAVFRPVDAGGQLIWPLVVTRWLGAALLVPLIEELFWRSFLMRWIDDARFERIMPQRVSSKAVLLSTFVFTLAHTLWLAAALAGLAYALLYIRTGKLWVAVLAHAITNGALGIWVIATGQWQFW